MNKIFVVEKVRKLPETNSSSAHIYEVGWPNNDYDFSTIKEEIYSHLSMNNFIISPHLQGEFDFYKKCHVWKTWRDKWNYLFAGLWYYDTTYGANYMEEYKKALSNFFDVEIKWPLADKFTKYLKLFSNEFGAFVPEDYDMKSYLSFWDNIFGYPETYFYFMEKGIIVYNRFDGDGECYYEHVKEVENE